MLTKSNLSNFLKRNSLIAFLTKTYLPITNLAKIMEEKFLQIDGNKIRYLESGNSNQTLVLVHGLGASAERWSNVIPIFSKNFKVIVPDLIGFGYSDKPLLDYTPEFFSDFLYKFFVESAVEEPFVVGSSLGGQISVEYASTRTSDVKKLVLVSPAGIDETIHSCFRCIYHGCIVS